MTTLIMLLIGHLALGEGSGSSAEESHTKSFDRVQMHLDFTMEVLGSRIDPDG